MKKTISRLFIGLLSLGALTTSCEDMLTPSLDRYAEEFTGRDTVHFYAGILGNLQNVTEQHLLLGELRGDLVQSTSYVSDSIGELLRFEQNLKNGDNKLLNRAAYYKVINQCNYYLNKVDLNDSHNGDYYMRREGAQVLLIRAWTYMQLVQTYGRVPFITEPVDKSDTNWEKNPKAWATPDNLLDLLKEDLTLATVYCEEQGYPNYGSFDTGSASINHQLMLFDAEVVAGDMYLLCGKTTADFEKAAEHFYNFIHKYNRTRITTIGGNANVHAKDRNASELSFEISNSNWNGDAHNVGYTFGGNEIVTGVASASNSNIGTVLTRIPEIYGFTVKSSFGSGTIAFTDGQNSGNPENLEYGSLNLTPDYTKRQLEPSNAYIALNKAQTIVANNPRGESRESSLTTYYPKGLQDARMNLSAPQLRITNEGTHRFIAKFCGANSVDNEGYASRFTFRFLIPLYRYRTILLHYAEALNRAGYPGHAFAILRDGLNESTYPELIPDTISVDDEAKTITRRFLVQEGLNAGDTHIQYISADEIRRAADKPWITELRKDFNLKGVHSAGCGVGPADANNDYIYNYTVQVGKRLAEENSVSSRTTPLTEGYDLKDYENIEAPVYTYTLKVVNGPTRILSGTTLNLANVTLARKKVAFEENEATVTVGYKIKPSDIDVTCMIREGQSSVNKEDQEEFDKYWFTVTFDEDTNTITIEFFSNDIEPEPVVQHDYSDYTVNDVVAKPVDEAEQLAIELLLADEYALETAFEGHRFYDLTRIARHLNTFVGGNYGTEWLAWKIARRTKDFAPYASPFEKDADIYNLLLNPENWYLHNPE